MTISEGVCDYCGRERLLETGDENSVVQFGKLWCGICREGSRQRYIKADSPYLEARIDLLTDMLNQHPIAWEEPHDHIIMHLYKLSQSDEVWRMKQELRFRSEDV